MLSETPLASTPEMQMRFKIFRSINLPLERLTVQDICKTAHISRDTFYRYFTSKFDVLVWHGSLVQSLYLDQVGLTVDWETGYFHDLRLLAEEKETYEKALVGLGYKTMDFIAMNVHREETLISALNARGKEIDDDLLFYIKSYVMLETVIVTRWLINGCDPEPAVMAKRLTHLVPAPLFKALEL